MPRKKKSRRRLAPSVVLSGAKIVSTSGIEFKARGRKGTQYQPIIDDILRLKAKQSLVIPVPKDIPILLLQNRLNAVMKRLNVKDQAPKGTRFAKGTDDKGNIVISCQPKR